VCAWFERSILGLALALCIAGWIYDRQVWQPLQRQRKAAAAYKKANNNESTEQFHLLISDCKGIGLDLFLLKLSVCLS
jgi:hypothetical protein